MLSESCSFDPVYIYTYTRDIFFLMVVVDLRVARVF